MKSITEFGSFYMIGVSVPVALMAAICFYVGSYYLWLYIRRRAHTENFVFSFVCFSIMSYDIFCVGLYNAETVEQGMFWQQLQFISINLFSIAMTWFAYFYTRYKTKRWFIVFSGMSVVFLLLNITVRNSLTLSIENPLIRHIKVGSIIDFTIHEVEPGILWHIQLIGMIIGLIYLLYVLIQHYRSGFEKHARPILIAMGTFFLACLNDAFIGTAVYSFVYLIEYAFMFIILSMSHVLLDEFVDLHLEVQEFNIHLEEKVKERTMELLFSEIGTKLYLEMQNELLGVEEKDIDVPTMHRLVDKGRVSSIISLSEDISIITNFDLLIDKIVEKLIELTDAEAAYLFLEDDDHELDLKAFKNSSGSEEEYSKEIIDSVYNDGAYSITVTGQSGEGKKSVLCVPISTGPKTIGICYLDKMLSSGEFNDKNANLLIGFLAQVAAAIENASQYNKMKSGKKFRRQSSITSHTEEKIKEAIAYIDENYCFDISREGLASSIDVSPDHLGKYFKIYTGTKIGDYINELRIKDAAKKLRETDKNIIDIAFSVGFESLRTFNRVFLKIMDITPTEYRETE